MDAQHVANKQYDDYIVKLMSTVANKDKNSLNANDLQIMKAYANIRVARSIDKLRGE